MQGAQYVAVKGVDAQQSVDDFKALWMAVAKMDVDPSLVTLHLVRCGSRKPTAEEEEEAVVLDDPRLTLAAAGVTDGCLLLATFVKVSSSGKLQQELFSPSLPRLTTTQALPRGTSWRRCTIKRTC